MDVIVPFLIGTLLGGALFFARDAIYFSLAGVVFVLLAFLYLFSPRFRLFCDSNSSNRIHVHPVDLFEANRRLIVENTVDVFSENGFLIRHKDSYQWKYIGCDSATWAVIRCEVGNDSSAYISGWAACRFISETEEWQSLPLFSPGGIEEALDLITQMEVEREIARLSLKEPVPQISDRL